jgi:hypothetical protein
MGSSNSRIDNAAAVAMVTAHRRGRGSGPSAAAAFEVLWRAADRPPSTLLKVAHHCGHTVFGLAGDDGISMRQCFAGHARTCGPPRTTRRPRRRIASASRQIRLAAGVLRDGDQIRLTLQIDVINQFVGMMMSTSDGV